MSCCGRNRQRVSNFDSRRQMLGVSLAQKRTPPRSLVYFEYVGKTALTVIGPITGKRYRFPKPGAKIAVDSNDAPLLTTIPRLVQTHSP
jgi:hypothetical protein